MSKGNEKDIIAVHYNDISINKIYQGLRLVGERKNGSKSCFGSGFGINIAPGLDVEAGKNN